MLKISPSKKSQKYVDCNSIIKIVEIEIKYQGVIMVILGGL